MQRAWLRIEGFGGIDGWECLSRIEMMLRESKSEQDDRIRYNEQTVCVFDYLGVEAKHTIGAKGRVWHQISIVCIQGIS